MSAGLEAGVFFIVYKTTNTINGKFYIGQHATKRLNDGYIGSGKALKAAIAKHGKAAFRRELLGIYATRHEMDEAEKRAITPAMLADPQCYNLIPGGQCARTPRPRAPARSARGPHSSATREAMSRSARELRRTIDTQAHARLSCEGRRQVWKFQRDGEEPVVGTITGAAFTLGVPAKRLSDIARGHRMSYLGIRAV